MSDAVGGAFEATNPLLDNLQPGASNLNFKTFTDGSIYNLRILNLIVVTRFPGSPEISSGVGLSVQFNTTTLTMGALHSTKCSMFGFAA